MEQKLSNPNNIPKELPFRFQVIEGFINAKRNREHLNEIILSGLKVFTSFDGVKSSALYLLNENTFDFDFKTSYPNVNKKENIELFNQLIDKGAIGQVLQTGEPNLVVFDKPHLLGSERVFIIPMFIANNVLGLVTLIIEDGYNVDFEEDSKLYKLFSSIYALVLDNALLLRNLKRTQILLEQKVAARTINIAQSRRELQTILDSVQAAILVIDSTTNRIISVNPNASLLIGDNPENIIGKQYTDFLVDEETISHIEDPSIKFSRNYESSLRRIDGHVIPILRTTSNIKYGNQRLRIESFFDITERKEFESALKEANELLELKVAERTEELQILVHKLKNEIAENERKEKELTKMLKREQELNELKSSFISMVSHEYRTPLTIIKSSAQIMSDYYEKFTQEERQEFVKRIIKNVDYMRDLMENVLLIGKFDAQEISLNLKNVNLNEFINQVIEEFKLTIAEKRIFNQNILVPENTNVKLDPSIMKQVLFNLLNNAIKYSLDTKPIDIELKHDNKNIYFSIKDYGVGIPEDEQEKIFDLFYRSSNVSFISGSGLGLTIVKKFLDIHNGKISLTSKVGEGSTFVISIPFIPQDA